MMVSVKETPSNVTWDALEYEKDPAGHGSGVSEATNFKWRRRSHQKFLENIFMESNVSLTHRFNRVRC